MQDQNQTSLPWDEIVDRLYHRQDPADILNDLIKRNRIKVDDISKTLSLIADMKMKVESFRVGNK
jgi:hypothetical protein